MGWAYDYLKSKQRDEVSDKCPKSDKGESHKLEIWFEDCYCSRCNVKLK